MKLTDDLKDEPEEFIFQKCIGGNVFEKIKGNIKMGILIRAVYELITMFYLITLNWFTV